MEPGVVDCPAPDALRKRLTERIGSVPSGSSNVSRFVVQVSQSHGKYAAEIRKATVEGPPVRSIGGDARSCREIVEAVILSLSLLLEAERDVPATNQPNLLPPASENKPAKCPSADVPKCPACSQPRAARSSWFALGPTLSWHDLPKVAEGAELMMGMELHGPWELIAGGALLGAERKTRGAATFAFSLTEAWVGLGLGIPLVERLRFHAEVAPLLGVLHSYPESPLPLDPGDSYYAGLRGGSRVFLRLVGPLAVGVGVAGELRAKRWEFRLQDSPSVVWRQPWFGARAEVQAILELE
jgi:hypothetical protein